MSSYYQWRCYRIYQWGGGGGHGVAFSWEAQFFLSIWFTLSMIFVGGGTWGHREFVGARASQAPVAMIRPCHGSYVFRLELVRLVNIYKFNDFQYIE